MTHLEVRRASAADAEAIVAVLEIVVSERIYSAIDKVWSIEQEAGYLESLSSREAFHVAVDEKKGIVGLQSLERWSTVFPSMSHVAQVGTFFLPEWRGKGGGRLLWAATAAFARQADYRKVAIQVRASNVGAQAFYRRLGFNECGRLARQVVIDGVRDDEVLMELFL
jgi:ribosomal protein S18 acetylase RimI-like enzyme